jgi:hypothetical protein
MSAPDTARVTQAVRVLWELLKYWLASMAVCFCVLVAVGAFYSHVSGAWVLVLMAVMMSGCAYRECQEGGTMFWIPWIAGLALWLLCIVVSGNLATLYFLVSLPLFALGFFVGVPMLFYPPFVVNFLSVWGVLVALAPALIVFGFRKRQREYGKVLLMAGLLLWTFLGWLGRPEWLLGL